MSSNGNNSAANSSRNPYSFADFSLRRLLLQGARAARGSPQLGGTRLCDVERGGGGGGASGSGGGMDGRGGSGGGSRHEKAASVATGSVGPTVTVHASGSAASGASRTTGDDATSQHSTHGSPSTSTGATTSSVTPHTLAAANGTGTLECPLCCIKCSPDDFYLLWQCRHFACRVCLVRYLMIEILESRTDIACPECAQAMHPSDIQALLVHNPVTVRKYEDFMVRRVLLADPDSRWCPAPDCSYAVIASGCASCPRIRCERPGCDINFCYHCKAEWHPDQTCDAARAARHSPMSAPSGSLSQDSQHRDDIKPCPRCQVLIVKMDDGSCNHMVCAVCGSEFCWLCMKVISDLHYLSPSGCTFWGKKPWSRKKKLLWQLGTLVGAPVGIALVAGIAVPAMIIGIPVWVGRKVHTRYKEAGKHKRNCAVLSGVIASVLVSPVLAGLAVAIGVPILLFYVYGVVPVSLCRAGCGVSTTRDGFKFDFDEEGGNAARHQADAASADAVSRLGATSIGEVSLSVASGTHLPAQTHQPSSGSGGLPTGGAGGSGGGAGGASVGGGCSATAGTTSVSNVSTAALAGSITGNRLEVSVDVSTSETASAVTCVSDKSSGLQNDTASTKALAGSLLSYRQALDASNFSEDGMSERVRFDNVCYVIDGRKTGSDQELSADKASVGSCRSFRSSDRSFRDDVGDSASLSSLHKRIMNVQQRLAKTQQQHQQQNAQQSQRTTTNASSSSNITPQHSSVSSSSPAVVVPSKQATEASSAAAATTFADLSCDNQSGSCTPQPATASAHGSPTSQSSFVGGGGSSSAASAATPAAATTTTITTTKSLNTKNMSNVAILRNLFFSQHSDGGGGNGGSGGGGGSNSSSSGGGDKT